MSRLLVVDDEARFLRALAVSLRAHGFEVDVAETGAEGLARAEDRHPDLIVLDLGLPDFDGVEVLRSLRTWTEVPVIVLSARDAEQAKVEAFDAGADDFITKPFGMSELHARVRAALRRRVTTVSGQDAIETDDFTIDIAAMQVRNRAGAEIHLTPTEWRFLELLVENEGRPVSQDAIVHRVWGPHYDTDNDYARIYMRALRRKLEPDPAHPRYLITARGLGYRFSRSNVAFVSSVRDQPAAGSP